MMMMVVVVVVRLLKANAREIITDYGSVCQELLLHTHTHTHFGRISPRDAHASRRGSMGQSPQGPSSREAGERGFNRQ